MEIWVHSGHHYHYHHHYWSHILQSANDALAIAHFEISIDDQEKWEMGGMLQQQYAYLPFPKSKASSEMHYNSP